MEVSVRVEPEAEEEILALLEKAFGQWPSVYEDIEKRTATASVFVESVSREQRALLKEGLGRIARAPGKMALAQLRVRRIARENWAESWKRHFNPLEISPRLLVLPSWSRQKPKRGQAVVILDPGLSFGTGHHPTTAFCLEQIASVREESRGQSLLDVGCGSGILSIAAAKLGYSPVIAFDLDPDAVRVAKENAAVNLVRIQIACRDLEKFPLRSRQSFDVVCANLIYDLLIQQRDRILARLSGHGRLVLAGILKEQFPKVQRTYEMAGLKLITSQSVKEWRSGAFRFRD